MKNQVSVLMLIFTAVATTLAHAESWAVYKEDKCTLKYPTSLFDQGERDAENFQRFSGPNKDTYFDGTVSPSNAKMIINGIQFTNQFEEHGLSKGGQKYTRNVFVDQKGIPIVENWLIHGAGHAWSGGNPQGSYTDSARPDASAEMLRFFLEKGPSKISG